MLSLNNENINYICYDSDSQVQLCQFPICKYQLCARLFQSLRGTRLNNILFRDLKK